MSSDSTLSLRPPRPKRCLPTRGAIEERSERESRGRSRDIATMFPICDLAGSERKKESVAPALIPISAELREAHRFFGGAEEGARLVENFLMLSRRAAIGDDAAACLHDHRLILDHGGAQHDAGIHAAIAGEITDRAAIEIAPLGLELVDDLHRAHLGRAREGAGRETGEQRVERVIAWIDPALDMRADMHDMAVALDHELLGDMNRADLRDAANIIARQVEE